MPTPRPNAITYRIGMISPSDLDDPDARSGTPHRISRALAANNIEIVPILVPRLPPARRSLARRAAHKFLEIKPLPASSSLRQHIDDLLPRRTRRAILSRLQPHAARIHRRLDELARRGIALDALAGWCVAHEIYRFRTTLPLIYLSDATSIMIASSYPSTMRGRSVHRTNFEIEKDALGRASTAVFSSPQARDSAVEEYGFPANRARVLALGAHVHPDHSHLSHSPGDPAHPDHPDHPRLPLDAPSRRSCQLLIVAANPQRKRVDLATAAAELLRARGVGATLHVVGPGTPRSRASAAVRSIGTLRLSDPGHRRQHQRLLGMCHLQLLPSRAEAFGIAPSESAHYARPSIVSGTGGLPFVVRHQHTGLVLDVDAPPERWAAAVESLIDDHRLYHALSAAALARACAELNWEAWGRSMRRIIRQTIEQHACRPSAAPEIVIPAPRAGSIASC